PTLKPRVSPVRHGSRLVKRHCGTRRMKFYLVFFQEMVSRGSPCASHRFSRPVPP
ncbi:hypothetical protein HAX54_045465, partial [Datura stramonium]|nr:hypothetical protein [Datura stramonium]